jgi:hypothetical protein
VDRVLHGIKIDHITGVLANQPGTSLMALAGPVGRLEMYSFTLQNSIIPARAIWNRERGWGSELRLES